MPEHDKEMNREEVIKWIATHSNIYGINRMRDYLNRFAEITDAFDDIKELFDEAFGMIGSNALKKIDRCKIKFKSELKVWIAFSVDLGDLAMFYRYLQMCKIQTNSKCFDEFIVLMDQVMQFIIEEANMVLTTDYQKLSCCCGFEAEQMKGE